MTPSSNRIEAFYNTAPEYEWHRLERHPFEYALTLRALEQHLPAPPAAVCDIGGGVGRYAIELTRQGYRVTLVDLSSRCLAFAQAKATQAEVQLAGVIQGDARHLPALQDDQFDVVLLMGPLYHLLEGSERLQALREARRLLRPGGVLAASFIGRYAQLSYAVARTPDYVLASREECDTILATGVYRRAEGSTNFIDAYFTHPDEIGPLMQEAGFTALDFLGVEPLVTAQEEKMPLTDAALRERWVEVLWSIAREPCLLGSCGHLLYVGRKD